jgi:DNA helicase-2/ATP-dependent DNA helicase PcrA
LLKAEKAVQGGRNIPKGRITEIVNTCNVLSQIQSTGNADKDWRNVRELLEKSKCKRLNKVAQDSRNLRLLTRGGNFRELLAECWRENGDYSRALEYLRLSMQQEYLYQARNKDTGIVVMNMHKAKGKQFDEVIIFDGWPLFKNRKIIGNLHRLIRGNVEENIDESALYNVKVSVTRAKTRTTILTPGQDPCILLKAK